MKRWLSFLAVLTFACSPTSTPKPSPSQVATRDGFLEANGAQPNEQTENKKFPTKEDFKFLATFESPEIALLSLKYSVAPEIVLEMVTTWRAETIALGTELDLHSRLASHERALAGLAKTSGLAPKVLAALLLDYQEATKEIECSSPSGGE